MIKRSMEQREILKGAWSNIKILEKVKKIKRSREHRKMKKEQGKRRKRSKGHKVERSTEQGGKL